MKYSVTLRMMVLIYHIIGGKYIKKYLNKEYWCLHKRLIMGQENVIGKTDER